MARHKSALKRNRQNKCRYARNRSRCARVRTFIKKVEQAVAGGDLVLAEQAFQLAQPEIHRGVTKGIFHRNTAARKLSHLAARLASLRPQLGSNPLLKPLPDLDHNLPV